MANKSNNALNRLLVTMKKLSVEVNDQEICKKLEVLISTTKEEVNPLVIKELFDHPETFDSNVVPEPFCQYVRHFTYMIRRNEKLGVNLYDNSQLPEKKKTPSAKPVVKKKAAKKKKA